MTAIDYIQSLERIDFRIERKKDKIERLEILAQNLSSKPFDSDRVKTSGTKDRIGDLAIKIMEEKQSLAKLIEETEEKRDYVSEQIENMDNLIFSKIIYYRHVEKKSYEDITTMLDDEKEYSVQSVKNMHTKAIKEFNKTFIMP